MSVIVMQFRVPLVQAKQIASEWHSMCDDEMSEQVFSKVYGISEGGTCRTRHYPQNIYLLNNAIVQTRSDMIYLNGGVVWEKYFHPMFSTMIPADRNFVSVQDDKVAGWFPNNYQYVPVAVSLLGVNSAHWAHFLCEYVPKLSWLPFVGDREKSVKILMSSHSDSHMLEIVRFILRNHANAEIMLIPPEVSVKVDRLYHATKGSFLADHSDFSSPYMASLSDWAGRYLTKLSGDILQHHKIKQGGKREKVYLPRSGAQRGILNESEIIELFQNSGFRIITDPAKMSFLDKLNLFSGVGALAGATQSGVLNCLFCHHGTKVLVFSGAQRTFDLLGATLLRYRGVDFSAVQGVDVKPVGIHSSFSMDTGQIRDAMADCFGGLP